MKFEVKWTANNQGIESDYVDSLNNFGARSQVESMRGNMPGFRIIGVHGVRETYDNNSHSTPTTSNTQDSVFADEELSTMVAATSVTAGGLIAIVGLFMLPVGIIAGVIGGLVGWLGWKLATWLQDRGW